MAKLFRAYGSFYGTTIERIYKEGDAYKSFHTLHGKDLLAAAQFLIEAYSETRKLEDLDYEDKQTLTSYLMHLQRFNRAM